MLKIKKIYSALILFFVLSGCQTSEQQQIPDQSSQAIIKETADFQSPIKYAKGFTIQYKKGYRQIIVYNPWKKNSIYAQYYLVARAGKIPSDIPEDAVVIETPVQTMIAMSTTQLGILALLDIHKVVIGVSNGNYVNDSLFREMIDAGKIINVGNSQQLNLEQLVEMSPGMMMFVGLEKQSHHIVKIASAGIPAIFNIEWMEKSPLGRSEWLKFIAAFFNLEQKADLIFADIEKKYQQTTAIGKSIRNKPTILLGANNKGSWYMAGGKSYLARILEDAGTNYYWKNDSSSGSMPLSFEVVLEKLIEADIWIHPRGALSLADLRSQDPHHARFKAFRQGSVYNNNFRLNQYGGNDYWETGLVKPYLILRDLIKICHPELLPEHQLIYYQQLK